MAENQKQALTPKKSADKKFINVSGRQATLFSLHELPVCHFRSDR